MVRRLVRCSSLALLLMASAREAVAHDVTPTAISLRPNGYGTIEVLDPTGCAATITATTTDATVAKIYAADMSKADGTLLPGDGTTVTVPNRVDQLFLVLSSFTLTKKTATINICWIGQDVGGAGPCQEDNCTTGTKHPVAITVDPNAQNAGSNGFCGVFGDPVTTSNGEQYLHESADLVWRGPLPLELLRHYSSRSVAEGIASGRLGPGWRHSYEWSLRNTGSGIEVVVPDGRLVQFDKKPFDTAWRQSAGLDGLPCDLIDSSGGGFKFRDGRDEHIYSFDGAGLLGAIEDGRGNALTLSYTSGRLASVSDGLGRSFSFSYDGSNRLVQASDGTRHVDYAFDGIGRLTTFTNALGGQTSYSYDGAQPAQARLHSLMRPAGNVVWTDVWDGMGRITQQTDALGSQFSLAYDDVNGRTTTTDPLMATQVHTHFDGALTAFQFENGKSAAVTSDADGHRTDVADRLGGMTHWTWDGASRRLASRTDADGGSTQLTWTPRSSMGFTFHDLTHVRFADGTTESYAYDPHGNVTSRTDAAGGVWSRSYGVRGELLTSTALDGTVWHYSWNAGFQLESSTDPAGNQTDYLYDAFDRLVGVMWPDGSVISATWDALDRLTSVTDEDGDVTSFAYDANGNLAAVMLPDGAIWSFTWDAMDRLVGATDPDGNDASFGLDAWGRTLQATNAAGESITLHWTSSGNIDRVEDEDGVHSDFDFDEEDVWDDFDAPGGGSWSLKTSVTGHLLSTTSPEGRVRSVMRDLLQRPIAQFGGTGARTDYGYDAYGRRDEVSLPALGLKTELDLDGYGRWKSVVRGLSTWTIGRDAAGNPNSLTNPIGLTTTSTLDQRGRPTHVDLPGAVGSVDLTWTKTSQLSRALFSDALDLKYAYDKSDRLLTANGVTLQRDARGDVIDSNGIAIARDSVGRIDGYTFGLGLEVSFGYGVGGRLSTVTDWLGGVTTFGYDAGGRENSLTFPNGVNESRTFDLDGLLTRILTKTSGGTMIADLQFTYDGEGWLASASRTQPITGLPVLGTMTHSYNAAGEDTSFTYNPLGLRLGDGIRTYSYNLGGQLTGADDGWWTYTFGWNGLGNVDSFQAGAVSGTLVWNYGTGSPSVATVQQGGVDKTWFVSRPDGRRLYSIDAATNARTCYHDDESGNTIFTTGANESVLNAWAWNVDGKLLATLGPSSQYPFGEFTLGGQHYATSLGVGVAYGNKVYDTTSATTLQPEQSILDQIEPDSTPYAPKSVLGRVSVALRGEYGLIDRLQFAAPSLALIDIPKTPALADSGSTHSSGAWGVCTSCHFGGLRDGVTWQFGRAPRVGGGSLLAPSTPASSFHGGVEGVLAPFPILDASTSQQVTHFLETGSLRYVHRYDRPPLQLDDDTRRNLRRAVLKLDAAQELSAIVHVAGPGLLLFATPDVLETNSLAFRQLFAELGKSADVPSREKLLFGVYGHVPSIR